MLYQNHSGYRSCTRAVSGLPPLHQCSSPVHLILVRHSRHPDLYVRITVIKDFRRAWITILPSLHFKTWAQPWALFSWALRNPRCLSQGCVLLTFLQGYLRKQKPIIFLTKISTNAKQIVSDHFSNATTGKKGCKLMECFVKISPRGTLIMFDSSSRLFSYYPWWHW